MFSTNEWALNGHHTFISFMICLALGNGYWRLVIKPWYPSGCIGMHGVYWWGWCKAAGDRRLFPGGVPPLHQCPNVLGHVLYCTLNIEVSHVVQCTIVHVRLNSGSSVIGRSLWRSTSRCTLVILGLYFLGERLPFGCWVEICFLKEMLCKAA